LQLRSSSAAVHANYAAVAAAGGMHGWPGVRSGEGRAMPNEAPSGGGGTTPPGDVIREPHNSVVDDWLGQRVARDEARVEEALEQADGDEEDAELRFSATSREADECRSQHRQGGS
jgi:hypothetical protein